MGTVGWVDGCSWWSYPTLMILYLLTVVWRQGCNARVLIAQFAAFFGFFKSCFVFPNNIPVLVSFS